MEVLILITEYYPDMDLGSAMDFVRGLEYVREHGGIQPYTSMPDF